MADGDDDGADGIGPSMDASAGAGAPTGPGPGAPPPQQAQGGPIINALIRRRQGPQVSAPGAGDTANSLTMIMNAIGMLQQALPGIPPGSPLHRDVLKAASSLSRHAPQGAPAAGVQQTQLQDLLKNVVKSALMQRVMANQGGAQPNPGQGGAPPGAPQQPPMPSTPLPGA